MAQSGCKIVLVALVCLIPLTMTIIDAKRMFFPNLLSKKPRVSPLYLVNGTVCRFVDSQPICTTLSTTGLFGMQGLGNATFGLQGQRGQQNQQLQQNQFQPNQNRNGIQNRLQRDELQPTVPSDSVAPSPAQQQQQQQQPSQPNRPNSG